MLNLLNRYNHGLLAVAVLGALESRSVFPLLSGNGKTLEELSTALSANPGYLKIALRSLIGLGMLQLIDQRYLLNSEQKLAGIIPPSLLSLYSHSSDALLLPDQEPLILELLQLSQESWQQSDDRIRDLLDGPLIVFLLLALKLKSKVLPAATQSASHLASPNPNGHLTENTTNSKTTFATNLPERSEGMLLETVPECSEDMFLALAREGAELELSASECSEGMVSTKVGDFDYIYSQNGEEFFAVVEGLSPRLGRGVLEWMVFKGFVEEGAFTPLGLSLWQRVFNFGVMASYRPMLARFGELLFGDAENVFARDSVGDESHLDRTLNVIGSGFQHQRFFADFEKVLIEIFDSEDFAAQPRYVCDMGCGDGALLLKVFKTVLQHTRRGKVLDLFPLVLIGADYNQASLLETSKTLESSDFEIPFLTIHADIGDPQKLLDDLAFQGIWDRDSILHVRSFLDHDRPLLAVADTAAVAEREKLGLDGAYVSRDGSEISPAYVLQNLVEHLRRWSFVIGKHGLLVLEVHSLPPEVIAQWFDECENFHFDASQALSGQLLVEADKFLIAAAEVGLFIKDSTSAAYFARYPKTLPFTRITLNCFERRPYTISLARQSDVAQLLELELAWPEHLRCNAQQLNDRLVTCPEGVYVLRDSADGEGQILAVLYTQRIANVEQLKKTSFTNFPSLHRRDGDVLQLISINVRPEVQNRGFGDILLEFVLDTALLNCRLTKAVGVTRFKSFDKSQVSLEAHFAKRDARGFIEDPIPRFHQSHGAELVTLLPDVRPDDFENLGCGVLIAYDLANRKARLQQQLCDEPVSDVALSQSSATSRVWHCVATILRNKNKAVALQSETALSDLGFDSLDLLELRLLLEMQFAQKIDPTFFFRYASTAAIAKALEPREGVAPIPSIAAAPSEWSVRLAASRGVDSLQKPHTPLAYEANAPTAILSTVIEPSNSQPRESRLSHWSVRLAASRGVDSLQKTHTPLAYEANVPYSCSSLGSALPELLHRASDNEPLAIVGLSFRLPGADTEYDLWDLLVNGKSAIGTIPTERAAAWVLDEIPEDIRQTISHGGFISDVQSFDSSFFRISRKEAIAMDPQQRILLETTWRALESAGINPRSLVSSKTGVFAGVFTSDYELLHLKHNAELATDPYFATGTNESVAAGRVSYYLGLQGPALSINTACSSSLVALDVAAKYLRRGDCDLALVAGVNLLLSPELSVTFATAGMLSPDGRCATFDAAANGYVRAEGCAVVVLKRYSDAVRDQDNIWALVRGSAVNQDGASNGLTAPNGAAQEAVIAAALADAGIGAEQVSYVETHGTATILGDPIEVEALRNSYASQRASAAPLYVGSVKSNIGHTEATAGLAGLIKVLLAMKHELLPPTCHFQAPNPLLKLPESGVAICQVAQRWPRGEKERYAAVSSFGFSGTNAHVILQEAPVTQVNEEKQENQLLVLSAASTAQLEQMRGQYLRQLTLDPAISVSDIAYTSQSGRAHFAQRLTAQGETLEQLRGALQTASIYDTSQPKKLAMLFTGQGSQFSGMGRMLFEHEPVFRSSLLRSAEILADELSLPLLDLLYSNEEKFQGEINNTRYTQPALFALEYALYEMWSAYGVAPQAVLGHSVGEYVAACVAGVFSQVDGLRLIAARGALMQSLPAGGAMLALKLSESQAEALIAPFAEHLSIAAVNGANSVVVSGAAAAIEIIQAQCKARNIWTHPLIVSHAFHSSLMQPILAEFEAVASKVKFSAPTLKLVSNLSGEYAGNEIATPQYWVSHLRQAVRFAAGVERLCQDEFAVFLELGARPVLLGMSAETVGERQVELLPSLIPGKSDFASVQQSVAQLYSAGHSIDWQVYASSRRGRKTGLPGYAFAKEQFWLDTSMRRQTAASEPQTGYQAVWRLIETAPLKLSPQHWLIFEAEVGCAAELKQTLHAAGQSFEMLQSRDATLLLEELVRGTAQPVAGVLYCCGAGTLSDDALVCGQRIVDAAAHFLVLQQQLLKLHENGAVGLPRLIQLAHVNNPSDQFLSLTASAALGMQRVLRSEAPQLSGGVIHLALPAGEEPLLNLLAHLVAGSLSSLDEYHIGEGNRISTLRLAHLSAETASPEFDSDATYLITGASGAVGFALAEELVKAGVRHFALCSRRGVSPEQLDKLKAGGAETVESYAVDVASVEAVQVLVRDLDSKRRVKGVIHAAGVVADAMIGQQSAATLTEVLAAKAIGAVNLHFATASLELTHFVCISSVASLLGTVGQANYAAANCVLDSLMQFRSKNALPGLSLNLGYVAESGMAARMSAQQMARLEAQGISPLSLKTAARQLLQSIGSEAAQVIVADIDWQRYVANAGHSLPLLADLVGAGLQSRVAPPQLESLAEILKRSNDVTAKRLLTAFLKEKVQAISSALQPPDSNTGFFDLGFDSYMNLRLRSELQQAFGQSFSQTITFEYPNIASLSEYLLNEVVGRTVVLHEVEVASSIVQCPTNDEPIAVISMSCRMPGGANSPEALHDFLRSNQRAVGEVPKLRWDNDALYSDVEQPGTTRTRFGSFIEDVEYFDAAFFGVAPREALRLDPQQRLLLEVSWEALENANIPPSTLLSSRSGLFVGIGQHDYAARQLYGAEFSEINAYDGTGSLPCFGPGRLAHALGLQGPVMAIDTACSSSLVALHLAMQSLRRGESDLALAGGVHLILSPEVTVFLSRIGALSSSGMCRAFDANADGYGRGEGIGILVLKRLSDAERDGDKIEALLVGSAVNHDGTSSGLTVPNRQAQERLLRDAISDAALSVDDVDYLEAHGTGTLLGDPIEVHAIAAAFAKREASQPLHLGSVKNNIGHLEAAAGVAGVIKVIQAMKAKQLPGHLFDELTPNVDWKTFPLAVNHDWQAWESKGKPRVAGVSSFGMSGTNAHIVIQEWQRSTQVSEDQAAVLLVSAKTKIALQELLERYQQLLARDDADWPAICATAARGRDHFAQRCAVVAKSLAQARRLVSAVVADSELRSNAVFFGSVSEDDSAEATQSGQLSLTEIAQRYVRGAALDLPGLFPEWRQARLPNYPFERQRFWIDAAPRREQSISTWLHPLLQKQSSFPSIETQVFESEVSLAQFPFLEDHKIYDQVVVPGAFHLSLLFAAAQRLGQHGGVCFEDILFHRALGLHEMESKLLQVVFRRESEQVFEFEILSFSAAQPKVWTKHVTGKLVFEENLSLSIPAQELTSGELQVTAAEFYPAMQRRDIVLGNSFRWIKKAIRCEQQLQIEFADPVDGKFGGYGFFPGLIDSCFQSLLAFVPEAAGIFVPFAVQQLRLSGQLPTASLRADIVLHSETEREIRADILLRDDQGRKLIEFTGVDCAAVAGKQEFLGTSANEGLFALGWEQLESSAETKIPTLIFGDSGVGIQDLPRLATEQREAWALVYPLAVDVVSAATAEALEESAVERAAQLAQFFQVMTQVQWQKMPTIVLLGLDAELAAANCAAALVHRALFSLAQVVALEHPELKIVAVSLENYAALEESFTRVVSLAVGCGEDHLRLVGKDVFAPRLVAPRLPTDVAVLLDPQKAYLITGAFGELGRVVAAELIAAGARKLALLSRREITENELKVIAEFEVLGAELLVLQADVGEREVLQRCLEKIRRELAPLGGVVHTAGVLDDAMLHNLKRESFATVMQAKLRGAYLLHELTAKDRLDHFVLFSSSAALLGALGQGNYAAANGFLDGLAQLRRSLGLAAVSINWGPWEVGMAAGVKAHLQQRLEQRGLLRFSVEHGRSVLRRCLQPGVAAQYCLQPLDKKALARSYSKQQLPSLLRGVVVAQDVAVEERVSSALSSVMELDSSQRVARLQEIVADEVRRVLGSSPQQTLSYQRGFLQLGMDSLMSVELRNNLQQLLEVKLAPTVAFNYSNVEMLALHLDYKLFGQENGAGKNVLAVEVEKVKKETVSSDNVDLSGLSLDELANLLEAELE